MSPTPGTPQTATKAVAALLTGLVGIAAMFVPSITEHVTPEVIGGIATAVGAALVYLIPNKPKP